MALTIAAHSPLLFAQTHEKALSEMSWTMQPGESLSGIAHLFYPNNKYMQQQFVAATIKANQDAQSDLSAGTVFTHASVIVIPSLKALSRKSRNYSGQLLRKSADSNAHSQSEISSKLQANYENLISRNVVFKQELEQLNVKLEYLQQVFAKLSTDLTSLFALYDTAIASHAEKLSEMQRTQSHSLTPLPVAPERVGKPEATVNKAPVIISPNLWKSILTALLFASLFVGLAWYSYWLLGKLGFVYKQKTKAIKTNEEDMLKPLDEDAFKDNFIVPPKVSEKPVDSLVELNKFSDSIVQLGTAVMPAATKELDEKDEGDLMLAQAKIYANIERYENAIRLLNAYIKVAPKAAWQHWLCLLEIYRNTDQKEAFLETAKQMHHIFNVVTPEWEANHLLDDNNPPGIVKHSLEEYDAVMDKVTKLWAECAKEANKVVQTKAYLDELLTDNRDSERSGFSMEAFEEIMLLREMLDAREKLAKEI